MKYFNGLNMGEGVAGPSTIGAATTAIYSCMGIAFVNRKALFGGLYHYPSKCMGNLNVTSTIRQMFNDVKPDEIVLTPAQDTSGNGVFGSSKGDISDVHEFLKDLGGKVTIADAGSLAVLTWQNDAPVFNRLPDNQTVVDIPAKMRVIMKSTQRELEASIWYYGGDGETDGVLDQDLKSKNTTTPKGCCIIM